MESPGIVPGFFVSTPQGPIRPNKKKGQASAPGLSHSVRSVLIREPSAAR